MTHYNYLIIGTGVIGLSIARKIRKNEPDARILMIEKEAEAAQHSSGRNSGVLHAGFYYSADSFKARFTAAGNIAMKEYCKDRALPINDCGKLVVAQNEDELGRLQELYRRGLANGSRVRLVSVEEAEEIEPNIRTYKQALYSPDTATIDPLQVCLALKHELICAGVDIKFSTCYQKRSGNTILTDRGDFSADKIINCAGLYADCIAQDFGYGREYTIIPFKGLYLKYTKNTTDIKINIYPVPDLRNPFLGVHFTKTVDGHIKIGPTAIPSFARENYGWFENLKWTETPEILYWQTLLFFANSFHFRDLAFEEMRKYAKTYFVHLAQNMVKFLDSKGFTEYTRPGIRAQLLNTKTRELVQDFVVQGDCSSIHVLNAVSPAYTCAFPFAGFIYDTYLRA